MTKGVTYGKTCILDQDNTLVWTKWGPIRRVVNASAWTMTKMRHL